MPLEAQGDDAVTELPEKEATDVVALSQKDAASDIEDILGDDLLPADPKADDEDKTADEPADPLADEQDSAEDVEEDDDAAEDGSSRPGQYVSPKGKYKLSDGTEITVAELARNNLYQRDYSQKTEALSREKDEFAAEKTATSQLAQTVSEERKFLIWFAEQNVPKAPEPPADPNDYVAEIEYARQKRAYDTMVESWRAFKAGEQQETERKTGETSAQARKRQQKEVQTLFDKVPMLKDGKKAQAFFDTLAEAGAKYYGFTQDEIANSAKSDHRLILALRDAAQYRRAKEKAPAVQKELTRKPVTVKGSAQRGSPQQMQQRSKKQATERLRETGSMRDGIAAIEALI